MELHIHQYANASQNDNSENEPSDLGADWPIQPEAKASHDWEKESTRNEKQKCLKNTGREQIGNHGIGSKNGTSCPCPFQPGSANELLIGGGNIGWIADKQIKE